MNDETHDRIFKAVQETIAYLYDRWQDEKEYEEFKDYDIPIKKILKPFRNAKFVTMQEAPFSFDYTLTNGDEVKTYRVTATERNITQNYIPTPIPKPKKMVKRKLKVRLEARPNPDYSSDSSDYRGRINIEASLETVTSFKEASEVCKKFIRDNELGSGNWTGGEIFENGKQIAHVSYNGRVWEGRTYPAKEIQI